MKTEVIQVKVTPELKKKVQQMADADRRNISDFVRVQIEKLIDEQKKK